MFERKMGEISYQFVKLKRNMEFALLNENAN